MRFIRPPKDFFDLRKAGIRDYFEIPSSPFAVRDTLHQSHYVEHSRNSFGFRYQHGIELRFFARGGSRADQEAGQPDAASQLLVEPCTTAEASDQPGMGSGDRHAVGSGGRRF